MGNLLRVCNVKMGKNQAVGGSQAEILKKYFSLETPGSIQVLYVWIDGSGQCLRCKTKTVYEEPKEPSDLPSGILTDHQRTRLRVRTVMSSCIQWPCSTIRSGVTLTRWFCVKRIHSTTHPRVLTTGR